MNSIRNFLNNLYPQKSIPIVPEPVTPITNLMPSSWTPTKIMTVALPLIIFIGIGLACACRRKRTYIFQSPEQKLLNACKEKNLARIKAAINERPNVNFQDGQGNTALHYLFQNLSNNTEQRERRRKEFYDLTFQLVMNHSSNAQGYVVAPNDKQKADIKNIVDTRMEDLFQEEKSKEKQVLEAAQVLIQAGASLHKKNKRDVEPVYYLQTTTQRTSIKQLERQIIGEKILEACRSDDLKTFKSLQEDILARYYLDPQNNPIEVALKNNAKAILDHLTKIDKPYLHAMLYNFSAIGSLGAVKFLIERCKLDPKKQDAVRYTALHYASKNGCKEVIQYLLHKHSNLASITDILGDTPKDVAKDSKIKNLFPPDSTEVQDKRRKTLRSSSDLEQLNTLVRSFKTMRNTLRRRRTEASLKSEQSRPQLIAKASQADLSGLKSLIDENVNVNEKDPLTGFTAIHKAVEKKHLRIFIALKDIADLTILDKQGRTPLALAEELLKNKPQNYFLKVMKGILERKGQTTTTTTSTTARGKQLSKPSSASSRQRRTDTSSRRRRKPPTSSSSSRKRRQEHSSRDRRPQGEVKWKKT